MAHHKRLFSGCPMRMHMRPAVAMIELIFAIVIIAISIMTLPTMLAVSGAASKGLTVDDDVMARLSGWTADKFQARWDGNYSASGSGPLLIDAAGVVADLGCSRGAGAVWYRVNPDSQVQCDPAARAPSVIPANGTGDLANGIEQLNAGNGGAGEQITITPSVGTPYTVTATYRVDYVTSGTVAVGVDGEAAAWQLGSSVNMNPNPAGAPPTHLKRVVIRFSNNALGTDSVLTFFKSNKGN